MTLGETTNPENNKKIKDIKPPKGDGGRIRLL